MGFHITILNALKMNTLAKSISLSSIRRANLSTITVRQKSDLTNQRNESESLRSEVLNLYKNLIYLSKEWHTDLRPQIKDAFMKNKDKTDADEIRSLIGRGEYVCRELIATYHLKKYRAMKRRYYSDDDDKKRLEEITKSLE